MPPRGVKEGSKLDRMYEHVKEGYEDRGVKEGEAEERAARTVNEYKSEHNMTKEDKKKKH